MPAAGQGEPRAGGWLQVSSGSRAVVKRCPRRCRYSLLWEEILGFPMYLRMGLRFLSSMASFSFFALLLCWDTREERWRHPPTSGGGSNIPKGCQPASQAPPHLFGLGEEGQPLVLVREGLRLLAGAGHARLPAADARVVHVRAEGKGHGGAGREQSVSWGGGTGTQRCGVEGVNEARTGVGCPEVTAEKGGEGQEAFERVSWGTPR